MMIGAILSPPGATERRRTVGAAAAGVLVLLIAWNFIYFWPLYTGTATLSAISRITCSAWSDFLNVDE